ncbi:hypothetical protein BJX70DRAFT_338547 [Aspergillus crustosus]
MRRLRKQTPPVGVPDPNSPITTQQHPAGTTSEVSQNDKTRQDKSVSVFIHQRLERTSSRPANVLSTDEAADRSGS